MEPPKKIFEGHRFPAFSLKQTSLYNLTFDEFICKHFNNLDHDEPNNKNMTPSCQFMQNPTSSSSSSSSSSFPISSQDDLSLEEFLISNGAINAQGKNEHNLVMNQVPLRPWQQEILLPMPVQAVVKSNFENKILNLGFLDEKLKMPEPIQGVAIAKNECKRGSKDEVMAKTIERRQRRMIKNRESAARSRATKQAYINQLQHNVMQLQTTNNRLKKRKEVEIILDSNSTFAPRYQLRRTSSTNAL